MEKNNSQFFTISDLANEFNISTRAIRYYEEVGLINPSRADGNRYRIYSRSDRARLKLILRGKRFGFSLEEIKEMIELFSKDRSGVKQFEKTIEFGNKKIKEIEDRIQDLTELKNELLILKEDFEKRISEEKKIMKGRIKPSK